MTGEEIRDRNGAVYTKIYNGLNVRTDNVVIFVLAIVIASVGLNMDSTATVIGAMLISPLMAPIVGIGLALAMFDYNLLRRAGKLLLIEVGFSLIASAHYFWMSPIKTVSAELFARTQPTIWDVVVAFAGGLAGVIFEFKKTSTNLVPGVAIATALMPPIATAGYGLATMQWHYFFGASYLFLINAFSIALATMIGAHYFQVRPIWYANEIRQKKTWRYLVVLSVAMVLPALVSASGLVQKSLAEKNAQEFVAQEFASEDVLKSQVDTNQKTIKVTTVGQRLSDTQKKQIQNKLVDYQLRGYHLTLKQLGGTQLTVKELKDYLATIEK